MKHQLDLEALNAQFAGSDPAQLLAFALDTFGSDRLALASSLSLEDQALTHLLLEQNKKARVFVLDTGRLFQKSYDTMDATMYKYSMKYEVYAPDAAELEALISGGGPNLFYDSVENRKRCCEVRKLRPLARVLGTVDAWVTGLRREHSASRSDVPLIEWDAQGGIYKFNPLASWTETQVRELLKKHKVPFNPMFDDGYPSIGCQPCTRPVAPGEDPRSGRWWWEHNGKRECGLHSTKL